LCVYDMDVSSELVVVVIVVSFCMPMSVDVIIALTAVSLKVYVCCFVTDFFASSSCIVQQQEVVGGKV